MVRQHLEGAPPTQTEIYIFRESPSLEPVHCLRSPGSPSLWIRRGFMMESQWCGPLTSWVSWITLTVGAFPRLGHRKLLSFIFLVPTLIDMMLSFSHPVKENRYKFMASSLLIGDVIKAPTPPKERWVLLITLSVQKYPFLLHSCSLT